MVAGRSIWEMSVKKIRKMLAEDQVAFYRDKGYLHIPKIFTSEEIDWLDDEHEYLVREWAETSMGWTGPWRNAYMDPKTELQSIACIRCEREP